MRGSRFPGLSLFVRHAVRAPRLDAPIPRARGGLATRDPAPALSSRLPYLTCFCRASRSEALEIAAGDDHRADDHRPRSDDQDEGLEPANMALRRFAAPDCRQK